MMRAAVTISLVPQAKGGPFVFWGSLEESCAAAAGLGFDAVEIFAESAGALDAGELGRVLDRHGLSLAAMGTGGGWVVHRLRLTDPDAGVRERAIGFVEGMIELAGGFGAPAIIGSMQGRFEGIARAEALSWLGEALERLGARAGGLGQTLLFEPLNRYETNLVNSVEGGCELLATLKVKNVRLLCDLFHMNIEEESIPGALRAAGPRVGHVHFVDSNRRAAGGGHLDYAPILEALGEIGYEGYLSAEVLPWPDSEQAARQSMAAFRKFVSAPGGTR